jgi:hypothetical protein
MPMPDGFLAGRRLVDGVERQGDLDELLAEGHVLKGGLGQDPSDRGKKSRHHCVLEQMTQNERSPTENDQGGHFGTVTGALLHVFFHSITSFVVLPEAIAKVTLLRTASCPKPPPFVSRLRSPEVRLPPSQTFRSTSL